MRDLILADGTGTEMGFLHFKSYDFEVGREENSFEIKFSRDEYKPIEDGSLIYIPDTEYGGVVGRMKTKTAEGLICRGGFTWRGRLQKSIISPPAGQDYATDSGELNAIVKARVEAALPGLFVGSSKSTGVTAAAFQYDRYCTLEEGLTKLLKAYGYRLELRYDQELKAVAVSAVPIVDYSRRIELSSDMRMDYTVEVNNDGVNHLICLGKGELKDRTVYHLYADANGNIGTVQHFFGRDEIADVYDYSGGELSDLIQSGRKRLEELIGTGKFGMTVDSSLEIGIGDIVGGRDYLSGVTMSSPIAGKIVTWKDGFRQIEYKLEDDINVEA